MNLIDEKIEQKKQEIRKQEDHIFEQECANDFYCLCGESERDHMELARLRRDLRELEQERDRNE